MTQDEEPGLSGLYMKVSTFARARIGASTLTYRLL